MPYDKEAINKACLDSVKNNNLESAYIRPMCFYGSEGMGLRADNLKVHVMVAAWAWGSYLGNEGLEKGIRIKTSSFTRHHVNITMCKAKANGNYMNSMLALQERRLLMVTMKRFCWIMRAMSLKGAAKIFLSCETG